MASMRTAKRSARRCLFGPVEPGEVDESLREMVDRFDEEKRLKWGFDFRAGRPDPGGHPQYEWFPVAENDRGIPSVYRRMGDSRVRGDTVTDNGPLGKRLRRCSPRLSRSRDAHPSLGNGVDIGAVDVISCSSSMSNFGPAVEALEAIDRVIENGDASAVGIPEEIFPTTLDPKLPNVALQVDSTSSLAVEAIRHKDKESPEANELS